MKFQIKNEFIAASFDSLGAELISLKSDDKEFIWEGKPAFWDKQSPVLFPTIGSLKDDTYFYEGNEYHLPRHGFAREKQFQVIQQSSDKIIFSLKEDQESLKVYPFNFELIIEYRLVEKTLEVHFKVINTSQGKMFFSIGGHPGLALSDAFENYSLVFDSDEALNYSLLENHLLSDEKQVLETRENHLPLSYSLFEKDALVFTDHKIRSVLIQENGKDFVKVNFENFPDLGIWTKVNAPFICIEPWFGHADEVKTNQNLEEKAGIIALESHEAFKSKYTIEIFV